MYTVKQIILVCSNFNEMVMFYLISEITNYNAVFSCTLYLVLLRNSLHHTPASDNNHIMGVNLNRVELFLRL